MQATRTQMTKAKDLAAKRSVPRGDALHALIACDRKAVLVTCNKDFQRLLDITRPKVPREII